MHRRKDTDAMAVSYPVHIVYSIYAFTVKGMSLALDVHNDKNLFHVVYYHRFTHILSVLRGR
jgi:hypothetical protein